LKTSIDLISSVSPQQNELFQKEVRDVLGDEFENHRQNRAGAGGSAGSNLASVVEEAATVMCVARNSKTG
jgi:hypothetical protein